MRSLLFLLTAMLLSMAAKATTPLNENEKLSFDLEKGIQTADIELSGLRKGNYVLTFFGGCVMLENVKFSY